MQKQHKSLGPKYSENLRKIPKWCLIPYTLSDDSAAKFLAVAITDTGVQLLECHFQAGKR